MHVHVQRAFYTFIIFKEFYAHVDVNKWTNNISNMLPLYYFLLLWQLLGKLSEVWWGVK